MEERRVRRSSVTSLALEFLLEAELERSAAVAVALGTFDGMALAGVGDLPIMKITETAALKLRGESGAAVAAFGGQDFRMSVIELPGDVPVLLTSVGAPSMSREVESGVVRILS